MKTAFFAINKPRGISSASVVNKVKFILKNAGVKTKVGNMGTLDVDASGVLVIAVNKATRFFDYYAKFSKTYLTTVKFGVETDTLDSTGKVINTSENLPTCAQIEAAIQNLIGEQLQIPPKYSAKKVAGERAYNLMRNGQDFELTPKKVNIYSIKIVKQIAKDEWQLEIECSSGTYIRAIARDIAAYNTTYGITTSIIRTKSSKFNLNNALDYNDLTYEKMLEKTQEVDKVFDFKHLDLTAEENKNLLDGKNIAKNLPDGTYFVYVKNILTLLVECVGQKLKIVINLMGEIND